MGYDMKEGGDCQEIFRAASMAERNEPSICLNVYDTVCSPCDWLSQGRHNQSNRSESSCAEASCILILLIILSFGAIRRVKQATVRSNLILSAPVPQYSKSSQESNPQISQAAFSIKCAVFFLAILLSYLFCYTPSTRIRHTKSTSFLSRSTPVSYPSKYLRILLAIPHLFPSRQSHLSYARRPFLPHDRQPPQLQRFVAD